MESAIKITKLNKEENQDAETLALGIVAFQMVKFEYAFYGAQQIEILDTKIMADGRQIVIDGNGFIRGRLEI